MAAAGAATSSRAGSSSATSAASLARVPQTQYTTAILDHVILSLVMRRASARANSASAVSDFNMAYGARVAWRATCLNASGFFLSKAAHSARKAGSTPASLLVIASSPHSVSSICCSRFMTICFLAHKVDLLICVFIYCKHNARPCRTICGFTCVWGVRHQPIVAERRRDTAAAVELDTIVLNRRFVRSRGDSDLVDVVC